MEFMNTLWLLLLLLVTATTVGACVVIHSRRKGQKKSGADEARRKAIEEQSREVEQEAARRAEEESKRLEEEAHREAERARRKTEERHRKPEELQKVEEQTRRKGEEAQRKAEEEEHLKAEETRRTADHETRRKAESEARQGAKEDEKGRQTPPVNRPPRRLPRLQEPSEKRLPQGNKSRRPKPEIVCWKRERRWIPVVEVPEEFLENPGLTALQNGSPLQPDESDELREACWRLEQAFGEVVVRWNEGEDVQEAKVALGQEGYLLFKLSDQKQNQGRRIKSPSSGSYLVMVPDNWERDETLSGPPPVTVEPVFLSEYQAHFFELEKDCDGKIAFRTHMGKSLVIESKASRFELVGTKLNEATEEMGPLFGERPPQIRTLDEQAWKVVGTIVVGEEGSGKGKWRTQFSPDPDRTEQDLPSEVAARKGGWYFLRFYDANDDLIESLDFRFICTLKEVRILQPSPMPSQGGHRLVSVQFLHEPGCTVQPMDSLTNIQIEYQHDKTILTVPPDPTCDQTRWLVGPEGGPQVEVALLVERLWWGIGEDHDEPSEWRDQPFTLSRDDFAATSKKALWLRLPRRGWVDKVLVGFEQPKARPYDVRVTEKTIAVPFREYGDSKEVGDRTQEHPFKVWIKHDEGVVAFVPAEQPTQVSVKKQLLRNLDMIPAPRLATVLTLLRRETVGALRVLIKEVRQKCFKKRMAGSREYKSYALCTIALALELNSRIPSLKNRWAVRAQLARDEFPEIMNRARNHYKEISTSCAYRADSMGDTRETA